MPSTVPMSNPRRSTFCSKTDASGPVSKRTVCDVSPREAVTAQESPCAPQHRHFPESCGMPRFRSRGHSFSTSAGTDDKLSVTLSTRTRISTRSAVEITFMEGLTSSKVWMPGVPFGGLLVRPCPTRQSVASLNDRPTNWTLSGNPSAVKPQGIDSVGLPEKLNGFVWMSLVTSRCHDSSVSMVGSVSFSRAELDIDGHTRQSIPASIRLIRSVISARTSTALAISAPETRNPFSRQIRKPGP